ncbi:MAG: hypothetical protein ACKO0Z_01225, partial [Betaproteobacteria bacterium]
MLLFLLILPANLNTGKHLITLIRNEKVACSIHVSGTTFHGLRKQAIFLAWPHANRAQAKHLNDRARA